MSGYVVAVTGGVASGKTALTRCFETLGAPVIDADLITRELVEPGQPALAEIRAAFGADVLDAHGRLNRPALRQRIVDDAHARRRLEAILHPRVREVLRARSRLEAFAYCILAIPLLAESPVEHYAWVDRTVVVDVHPDTQLDRLVRRDGMAEEAARRLIAAQAQRAARLRIADHVVINDGPVEALAIIAARLHARFLYAATQR